MKSKNKSKTNWNPVIKSFFKHAAKAGFSIVAVDNGDGNEVPQDINDAVEEVVATDESRVMLSHPAITDRWLGVFIVLGNAPHETICDYTCNPLLDDVVEAFSTEWETKETPTQ